MQRKSRKSVKITTNVDKASLGANLWDICCGIYLSLVGVVILFLVFLADGISEITICLLAGFPIAALGLLRLVVLLPRRIGNRIRVIKTAYELKIAFFSCFIIFANVILYCGVTSCEDISNKERGNIHTVDDWAKSFFHKSEEHQTKAENSFCQLRSRSHFKEDHFLNCRRSFPTIQKAAMKLHPGNFILNFRLEFLNCVNNKVVVNSGGNLDSLACTKISKLCRKSLIEKFDSTETMRKILPLHYRSSILSYLKDLTYSMKLLMISSEKWVEDAEGKQIGDRLKNKKTRIYPTLMDAYLEEFPGNQDTVVKFDNEGVFEYQDINSFLDACMFIEIFIFIICNSIVARLVLARLRIKDAQKKEPTRIKLNTIYPVKN